MSKKKKEKKKNNSSYKKLEFSKEDKRTYVIGNAFAAGGGRMTRGSIISLINKTYFGQLKDSEWIQEDKKNPGFFKPTNEFKKGFSTLIGKPKIDYGGNGASKDHKNAVINIIGCLPQETLINHDFKSEKRLTDENMYYKQTHQYEKDVEKIKENNDIRRQEATDRYNSIINNSSISEEDKILAKSLYNDEIRNINLRDKVIDDKRNISPADFQVTFYSKDTALEFTDKLKESVHNFVEDENLDAWMEQIRYMEERVVTTTELVITFNLEVITDTYRERNLIAKENWEYVTKQEINLFPV